MSPSGSRNRSRANASGSVVSSFWASSSVIPIPSPPRRGGPAILWLHGCLKESGIPAFAGMTKKRLKLRQRHALLSHIFAGAVGVGHFARLVALQEQELARALVRIDFGRQRRRVGEFQSHVA